MSKKQKLVTSKQFATLIGLSNRGKFYVDKVMRSQEKASLSDWSKVFIKLGLIDKEPSIIRQESSK